VTSRRIDRSVRNDVGQAAAFALIAMTTLAVALIAAIAQFGSLVVERSAAQTAADAAALAGVAGGREAAAAVARANGGEIVAWTIGPGIDAVTLSVRVGDVVASARATDAP
jgi:hypothetical protein